MTVVLIGVVAGAIVTIINEFIKQDGWPKPANAALALLVQCIGIVVVAVQHAGGFHGVDWFDVERALIGAVIGFAATYEPIVKGLLNDWLQSHVLNLVPAQANTARPALPPAPTKDPLVPVTPARAVASAKKAPAKRAVKAPRR